MNTPPIYRFGALVLDLERGALLTRDGAGVPLRRKSFLLLQLFAENAGRLLSRETIMAALWPSIFVSDESLTQCVRDVRRALGNESRHLLRTIPGRGYIFELEKVKQETGGSPKPTSVHVIQSVETDAAHERELAVRIKFSIRVLPLCSLQGSEDQQHLAESITGDIVTDLNRHLRQLAPGVAQILFHDNRLAPLRISCRGNKADFVLRGGVHGTSRPRVNLQLLDALTGACLWAERRELDHRHAEITRLMFEVAIVSLRETHRRPGRVGADIARVGASGPRVAAPTGLAGQPTPGTRLLSARLGPPPD